MPLVDLRGDGAAVRYYAAEAHLSCSLNSLKGDYIGGNIGDYYRVIKGDTRSLDF